MMVQPGMLEFLPHYGDWARQTVAHGQTQQAALGIRFTFDSWSGYTVLAQGTAIAQVYVHHPQKWQVWRDDYTVELDQQQLRLDTAETSKDRRPRIIDAANQVIAEYGYVQQQPVALILRGQQYPLGLGWDDPEHLHRFLNDASGRTLLRIRLRTEDEGAVQAVDVMQPLPAELAVIAALFAGLVPSTQRHNAEALTTAYKPVAQPLLELPLPPSVIEFIATPPKGPQQYLAVWQDQLLATIVVRRTRAWPLAGKAFELQTADTSYHTQTSSVLARMYEHLIDSNGTIIGARTLESSLTGPAFVYRDQAYPTDGDWDRGPNRRILDSAGRLLIMVKVGDTGVKHVDLHQSVAAGLALTAGVLALTNNYSPGD